jgi:hypothetical protein
VSTSTLTVDFVGVMCHYDPAADHRPNKEHRIRTIVIDGSKSHHPHEAFLEVPEPAVKSSSGWPTLSAPYSRSDAQLRRFTLSGTSNLSGVRLFIPSTDTTFEVESSFYEYVPPLGQIIEDFAPMRDEFIKFDGSNANRDLIAAHFDMKVGKLRVSSFDVSPSTFMPPFLWPSPDGKRQVPLAFSVQLELTVDNTNGIVIFGEFYKDGGTMRPLILNRNTRHITIGNLMDDDIHGRPPQEDARDHHFRLYYNLSVHRPAKNAPVPVMAHPRYRGMSGGCPGTQYPP